MRAQFIAAILLVCSVGKSQDATFKYWSDHYSLDAFRGTRFSTADFDRDGFPDLCISLMQQALDGPRVYWNRGNATFDAMQLTMPANSTIGAMAETLAVGDVDGDGDTDLLVPVPMSRIFPGFPPRVLLNQGNRQFSVDMRGPFPAESMGCSGGELFDADRDGDLDVIFWGESSVTERADRLWVNDGTGMFQEVSATHLPSVPHKISHVAVGDFDRDGDSDMAYAIYDTYSMILKNDGTGRFTTAMVLPFIVALHVAAGDADGDGYLDLFFSCDGPPDHLLINDGTGLFADRSHILLPYTKTTSEFTGGACFADMDNDGDQDLVISSRSAPSVTRHGPQLWHNNGAGRFQDMTATAVINGNESQWRSVLAADLDRDGDVDLVGNPGTLRLPGGGRVLTNLRRHNYAPRSVARNATFNLEFSARARSVVVPFLGLPGPTLPVPPLGYWALDLTRMIELPPITYITATSRQVPIFVPDNPWLSGQVLRVQSVEAGYDPGFVIKTTNWLPLRIQ